MTYISAITAFRARRRRGAPERIPASWPSPVATAAAARAGRPATSAASAAAAGAALAGGRGPPPGHTGRLLDGVRHVGQSLKGGLDEEKLLNVAALVRVRLQNPPPVGCPDLVLSRCQRDAQDGCRGRRSWARHQGGARLR
eukprot:CAMPEP_0175687714 /NCGR_PEP_ID=MMETSP0097-20121207/28516_1 /TAXON_ID=311494 /ORGANISM="Alexandrium monilatum, Strain CCMP3105" /LENGTH=140 /DNA_ID=CAMNT_0016994725 /DNA_START=310 /DNA_END=730 /DNA_ORIENTATION=+